MMVVPTPAAWERYAARMAEEFTTIDRLPRRLRLLIHEHGLAAVRPYITSNMDPMMVREVLRRKREIRQEKALARCA